MNIKVFEIIGLIMSILNAIFNAEVKGVKGKAKQETAAKQIAKNYPKLTMENILLIINHVVAILNILGILKDQS